MSSSSKPAGKEGRVLPKTNYEVVTPDYFKTVGTALLEGRDFNEHDSEDGEPVAIISQALAERIRAGGRSPLGSRIRLGLNGPHWSKVIGICADARYRSITQKGADIFVSYLQASQPTNYVVIRGTQSAGRSCSAGAPDIGDDRLQSNDSRRGDHWRTDGCQFGAASIQHDPAVMVWGVRRFLAASGVYSVIAETMAARRHEIAIKTALGAPEIAPGARNGSGARWCLFWRAKLLGALMVWGFGKLGSELLYGVSARDPLLLGSVAGFLFGFFGRRALAGVVAAGRDPKASLIF